MIKITAPITIKKTKITAPVIVQRTRISAPINIGHVNAAVQCLEGDSSGNLPAGKMLVTTGVGRQVITDDLPSGGGSVPFINTVEITYAELVNLISTDSVNAGTFYEITDYRTINDAGNGVINTGPIEHIIVQGTSANTISKNAFSIDYKKDELYYDITADGIVSFLSGEWEDNTSVGDDDIVVTNWTNSSFDMNRNPVLDDDFYIYAEDDSGGEVEYESSNIGVDFTITDLGGGLYRFTDLTGDIDFTNPDYNYVEINFNAKLISRNGYITYRKDTTKNIATNYDFRNCKYVRYLLDVSGVSDWDSGTTYNTNSVVIRNGHAYASLANNNQGNDPASKPTMWCLGLKNIGTTYYAGQNSIKVGNVYFNKRADQFVLLHTFSKQINANTFVFNIDKVADVSIEEENNVFVFENDYVALQNIKLLKETFENIFYGQVTKFNSGIGTKYFVLGSGASINDLQINQRLYQVTLSGYCQFTEIGKLSSVNINVLTYSNIKEVSNSLFSSLVRANVGYANFDLRIFCEDFKLGSNNRQIFISHGNYITIGNSNRNLEFYSFAFSNSSFGDLNKFIRFDGSTVFETSFGTNNGKYGTWLLFHGVVRGLIVGNDCFYLGLSGPFTTTVQNVRLVSNVSRLRITGQFVDCQFGSGVSTVNCKNCQRVIIGNNTSQIVVSNSIYDCEFAAGLNWFRYSGNGNFLKNKVYATHVNFDHSTHVKQNYYCTIIDRPDGTKRLTYIDDTDNLAVVDVTA